MHCLFDALCGEFVLQLLGSLDQERRAGRLHMPSQQGSKYGTLPEDVDTLTVPWLSDWVWSTFGPS